MTLIKMRIGCRLGNPHYVYPPQYVAEKVKYGPIYESGLDVNAEKARARYVGGVGYEEILIGVDDRDASQFLAVNGYSVNVDGTMVALTAEVVDRAKAVAECTHWMGDSVEKITDQKKVLTILAKVARKQPLTPDEEKALDPNDPTPGIGRSKTFEETIDEFLTGR